MKTPPRSPMSPEAEAMLARARREPDPFGDHDPSGRACAIAGRVFRGDQPDTGDACPPCLAMLRGRDSLGRPVTRCCGALVLPTRPYACVHERDALVPPGS